MPNIAKGKESVIFILHEIYGINPHIKRVCEHYSAAGYDVICPDFVKVRDYFGYKSEAEAYQYFANEIGFPLIVNEVKIILMKVRKEYKNIFLMGFSVGATTAWLCSERKHDVDGVICYYGSRIRDYQNITPGCPTLLIFAKKEKSFNVIELTYYLKQKLLVDVQVLNGRHGFSDPFSKHFNRQSQQKAQKLADEFLLKSMNVIYDKQFSTSYPARTTIGLAALPSASKPKLK